MLCLPLMLVYCPEYYSGILALRAHNLGAADLQGTANLNPSLCLLSRMSFEYFRLPAICLALAIPIARNPQPLHLTLYTPHRSSAAIPRL